MLAPTANARSVHHANLNGYPLYVERQPHGQAVEAAHATPSRQCAMQQRTLRIASTSHVSRSQSPPSTRPLAARGSGPPSLKRSWTACSHCAGAIHARSERQVDWEPGAAWVRS